MKNVERKWRNGLVAVLLAAGAVSTAAADEDIPDAWYGDGGRGSAYALVSRGDDFAYTPSPEQWRDRNIYQLFTDRFASDGTIRVQTYRPAWDCEYGGDWNDRSFPFNRNYHHGGSWNGLRQQIPYLTGMGVTAVWISGVQQNDQGANETRWTPYHQYHVDNFFRCDPAMGTFQELKDLIDDLHRNGIAVILDVAPNHMCDKSGWGTVDEDKGFHWNEDGAHWWNNDNRHCAPFDDLARFHVHGTINNWDQSPENLIGQFKGTDDLDQDDGYTSDILHRAFKNLIDATDCDGFRVDAIKHIPYDWCRNWAQAIRNHAAWRGKSNFLMFGELFSYDTSALASWCRDGYGFNSALLFPLMQAMNSVFGYGYSSYQLGEQIGAIQNYGDGRDNAIAFLDNHDVNRFAMQFGGGDAATAKKIMAPAMTFLYLAPPVPLLYYGTEHMFNQGGHGNGSSRSWDDSNPDDSDWQREYMFDRGFQPGNAQGDMFSDWAKERGLYYHIQWLNGLRNKCRALRRGGFEQRHYSGGQGIYAFTKWYDDETALVVLNTADGPQDAWVHTGRNNTEFKENGDGESVWSGDDGKIHVSLDGKGSKVYIHGFADNSADLGTSGSSSGSASGALWSANTYGWPKEKATTADTIWVNTEAGPAATAAAAGSDFKVWLVYGFNNPTGAWDKVEMELNEDWASANGGWYHANLGNLSTGRLDYIVCVETNAAGDGTYWDHNPDDPSGNYVLTISPAPEYAFASVGATPTEPADGGDVTITAGLAYPATATVGTLKCVLQYDFEGTDWKTVQMEKAGVATNAAGLVTYFTHTLTGLPGGQTLNYRLEASLEGEGGIVSDNGGANYAVRVKMSSKGIAWHCPTNSLVPGEKHLDTNLCMRWPVTPKAGGTVELYFGNYQGGDPNQTTDIDEKDEPMNMNGGKLFYQFVDQIADHSAWGAWTGVDLGWANRNAHDNYWKGTVEVPAEQAGNYFVYYFQAFYEGNQVGLEPTFVYMDPDNSAMYRRTLDEADAQASPFEVAIEGARPGDEPGFIWHNRDIIRAGSDDKVRISAKIGYQQPDGTRWADEVIVRYRIDSDAKGKARSSGVKAIRSAAARASKSWTALTRQTNMTFQGTVADANPAGDAMIWSATIQDEALLDDRAVLIYEIYARRTAENGGNGQWKQAEYNAGTGACTFEYRMWSDGSGDLTVDGTPADYTTSKFFIDEAKKETVTVKVAYHAPDDAEAVEVFTNYGRRDEADTDWDGDGWPDGMIPPDRNLVSSDNCEGGYWQAIPMRLRQGAWEADLTTGKCGVYRITARYKASGSTNWTYYADNPNGTPRRDHVVVISPKKAMRQTMYELNALTTKATGCSNDRSGNFEELSEKLSDRDPYGEFSLDYLNRMGINCLWFQPIHPNLDYGRGNTDDGGNRYWPGSPYATKNYFSVSHEMSREKNEAAAVAAFTNFVRLCDQARSDNPPEGAAGTLDTINVMLDGVLNHTSFDAVFGDGWTMATNGLSAKAQAELDADPGFGATWRSVTASDTIPNTDLGIRWYSHVAADGHTQAEPATTWTSVDENDIANAPERYDFGKWNDVAELLYGDYSTMVKYDDRDENGNTGPETGRVTSEEDQYYYDKMATATKLLWKYMATYPEYWIKKTGNDGVNHWDASDDLGIDGLRCDYAQGLPNQFWEYTVNRTRKMKWNFLFMAESLDGGEVGFRSNRQFDILNENMVFRFTIDHVSDPATLQKHLEDRRLDYGNGLILLNLTCHDEVMPWGDPQVTASRYAMVSAFDGVPMVFYGQEQGLSTFEREKHDPHAGNPWVGFAKFEQNFGKWIPHFKTWNQMYVWTNPPYPAGDPNDSRAMAEFYGRINQARRKSPALQSRNRWFLNADKDGKPIPKIMFCAKWEEEGANPNDQDAVFAAVVFLNDSMEGTLNGHWGEGAWYDISPFAAKMGIENRADRLYNVVNLASTDTNFVWETPISGKDLHEKGLNVVLQGSWKWNEKEGRQEEMPAAEWTDKGCVAQYLKVYDVTGDVPPVAPEGITITDPSEALVAVAAGTASYDVVGMAGADIGGDITWSNAANGATGAFAPGVVWTQTVALAEGTNVLTFAAVREAEVYADLASVAGGGGVEGFGDLQNHTTQATDEGYYAGWFCGDKSGSIGITGFTGGTAYGLYANGKDVDNGKANAEIGRTIDHGDRLAAISVDIGVNWDSDDGNSCRGIEFQAADGTAVFGVNQANGPGFNWYANGAGATGVWCTAYGTKAFRVELSRTAEGYDVAGTDREGNDIPGFSIADSSDIAGWKAYMNCTVKNDAKPEGYEDTDITCTDMRQFYFDRITYTTAAGDDARATVAIVVPSGEGPGAEISISGIETFAYDPATRKFAVSLACSSGGTVETVPVWTATNLVDHSWAWTESGDAPLDGGVVQLDLDMPDNGVFLISIGQPPDAVP